VKIFEETRKNSGDIEDWLVDFIFLSTNILFFLRKLRGNQRFYLIHLVNLSEINQEFERVQ